MQTKNNFSPPPNFIRSLLKGFDVIANHITLVLFPLGLDLLIWFGPRLSVSRIIHSLADQVLTLKGYESPEMASVLDATNELWGQLANKINLITGLRSFPVGIPSLMTSRMPVINPTGKPLTFEINSAGTAISIWLLMGLFGLVLGSYYFAVVYQAAIQGEIHWLDALRSWPDVAWKVVLLTLILFGIFLLISIPGSFVISLAAVLSKFLGQCLLFIFSGFIIWLIFPFAFSPHGIFVKDLKTINSIKEGIRLTRFSFPMTSLFLLTIIVLNQGLDLLWTAPPEDSWFSLIGVVGHAFITTGMLAASFIYYRDVSDWIQELIAKRVQPVSTDTRA